MDGVGNVAHCLLRPSDICIFVASKIRGWHTFCLVDQIVNTLGSVDPRVSVTTTQHYHVAEETIRQKTGVTHLFIPITPYLQKYAVGWLWLLSCGLPIPELEFVKSFLPLFFLLRGSYSDSPHFTGVKAESRPG